MKNRLLIIRIVVVLLSTGIVTTTAHAKSWAEKRSEMRKVVKSAVLAGHGVTISGDDWGNPMFSISYRDALGLGKHFKISGVCKNTPKISPQQASAIESARTLSQAVTFLVSMVSSANNEISCL